MRPAGGAIRGLVAASSNAPPDAGDPRSMKLTDCGNPKRISEQHQEGNLGSKMSIAVQEKPQHCMLSIGQQDF